MRLNCGPTAIEKRRKLESWHKKFAWWPTRMQDCPRVCVWLEFYWRRGEKYSGLMLDDWWVWEKRLEYPYFDK